MNIAAVKIAQKQAGLADKEYRDILWSIAGVRSAKELDDSSYKRVLARLYSIIAVNNSDFADSYDQSVKTPTERKIWQLWYELKPYLNPELQTHKYLIGVVRRVSGCKTMSNLADLKKLSPQEAYKAIEGLKERIKYEEEKR